MIYLHCGWPKTGTTSLQASLVKNADALASAGIVYPEKWRRLVDGSHNDLADMEVVSVGADPSFEEVKRFLQGCAGSDVLLSSESLTVSLLRTDAESERLLGLIAAIKEVSPVSCLWTLRRFDRVIQSFSVEAMVRRGSSNSLVEWLMGDFQMDQLFSRMLAVERAAHKVTYVKFASSGSHNVELLHALDLPASLSRSIESEVSGQRRLNVGRSHKKVVAATHVDAISNRLGAEIDRDQLLRTLDDRDLQFEGDRYCEVLEPEVRQRIHEQMLSSALRCGFEPYVRFFGGERVDAGPAVDLDADVLSDDDLARLRTHIERSVRA